MKTVNN